MRELDPINFKLSGDTNRGRQLLSLARTQAGFLRAMLGDLPFGRLRKRYPDGSEIDVTYHYGQYVARIFVPGGAEEGAVYYPLFMMRRPDLEEYQDEILLWDHAVFPNTALPMAWRSRMARPETYDEAGNAVLPEPREMCGDVDWTGWNGLSLSWDGHNHPDYNTDPDEGGKYAGLNNRYFFNAAMAGINNNPGPILSRIYFSGIALSWTSRIQGLLGAAISTVTVGGEQGTYIHYVTYFPGTSSTRAIRIFRRPFDIATGKFTSFPSLRHSFRIGTGSGRYAGPFHFNASGTVAKGIATKKRDDSDNADDLQIVTFTIDPDNGNVTVEHESAVTEYVQTVENDYTVSLVDTGYPPTTLPTGTISADADKTHVFSLPRRYIFRSRSIWTETRRTLWNIIAAVDWVGDEPVMLRFVQDRNFTQTNDTTDVFKWNAASKFVNTGVTDFESDADGGLNFFDFVDYTGDAVPGGSFAVGPYYEPSSFMTADSVGYSAAWFGNYTSSEQIQLRFTVEGAYAAEIIDKTLDDARTIDYGGTDSAEAHESTATRTNTWTHTITRNADDIVQIGGNSVFLGLDLRNNVFILKTRYREPMAIVNSGTGFGSERYPFTEATAIDYRYFEDGRIDGKSRNETGLTSALLFAASYVFLPSSGDYNTTTGAGTYHTEESFGIDDVFITASYFINVGRIAGPSYDPASLAVMNFKPGLNDEGEFNKPLAVFYSYTIDQSDADIPAPNEVYAGIVSNVEGMNRTQEQLRELFGDGELPYAEQDLEQDLRPVRFGGFNKPVAPDVPLFIPYP